MAEFGIDKPAAKKLLADLVALKFLEKYTQKDGKSDKRPMVKVSDLGRKELGT